MDVEVEKRNIFIALGTLVGGCVIIGFMKTWKWFSRTGKIIIDLPTIGKLFIHIFGMIGTVLLCVIAGVSIWWLIFYKRDYETNFSQDISSIENLLKIFLIVSFLLKTLDIIHLIIRQTSIDIFFMDWERSRTGILNNISIWRTYFVANEFNEIQTFRRIDIKFQLFAVLFLLKVINLENLTCAESEVNLSLSAINCTEYNSEFRIGISFLTLLGTAVLQYLAYILFYQRFIEDRILNFVDLCSVSNISVFIFDENHHGYYIHGRSPHGITDVNMKEILMNFYRERSQLSGTRGLQNNSNEQLFIMKINRNFRRQYDLLLRNYYNYSGTRKSREDTERYTDILLQSYQNVNAFLCAFINHSLPTHTYYIRNRYLIEKILNYEFQVRLPANLEEYTDNLLFVDNEKVFTEIFFYGEERSLWIWNITTFIFIDYLAKNFVLAAIITYILNEV